jgi:hypothetical protein
LKRPIIASRRLQLKARGRSTSVLVRIRQPFASIRRGVRDYACEFEIVRNGKTDAKLIYGIDAMQALLLTITAISKELRPLAKKLDMVDERIFPYAVVFADSTQPELRREVDRALMREEYRVAKRVAKRLGLDDED